LKPLACTPVTDMRTTVLKPRCHHGSIVEWSTALSLHVIGEHVVSYSVVVENVGDVLSVFYEYLEPSTDPCGMPYCSGMSVSLLATRTTCRRPFK